MSWRRRCARLVSGLLAVGAIAGAIQAEPGRATATTALWVDRANGRCSDAALRDQVSRQTPWCSVTRAAQAARAGDTVFVLPGRYVGTVRPTVTGLAAAPIRFVAPEGGVTIDAAGATVGLKVLGVGWLSFEGFRVTGAARQGVFVDDATGVTFTDMVVTQNAAQGIQLRANALTISDSTISENGSAGISELAGSAGNVYRGNAITGNGKDGARYNGDGIQLNGTAAIVRNNMITGNGDRGIYEHGIYAGSSSSGYLVESNTLARNAASDIKAAGSNGTVRYNRLEDSRLGLVLSDNVRPVSVYYNLIVGRFQHAVFFTTGTNAARARLWDNTIVQTGSRSEIGDASAVFVGSAALVELRNNLICYANRDDLGAAVFVADVSRSGVVSNTNWLCGRDTRGRSIRADGARLTLSEWRRATGEDGQSLSTRPPAFDRDFRVTSRNLGAGLGQPLGLVQDFSGLSISTDTPDIGAYQTPS